MAKENGKKDFENIAELTREFEAWRSGFVGGEASFTQTNEIQAFQFRAMLAQAQQLAVISGTLKEIRDLWAKAKSSTE